MYITKKLQCFQCYVCGEQLRGRYLTFKDKPICEKDFKVCIVSTIGIPRSLQSVGHVCIVCDKVITGEVFLLEEAYYCEKDFQVFRIFHVNHKFSLTSKEISSLGSCVKCGNDIKPDDSLKVGDLLFHHACLECEICKKNMEGKSISLDNKNRVYCTEDYTR